VRAMLAKTDAAAGGLARLATTLGQCALVVLGVHLAADNLDDRVLVGLTAAVELAERLLAGTGGRLLAGAEGTLEGLPLPALAACSALAVETAAVGLLCGAFLLTPRQARPSWCAWRRALGVRAVVVPVVLSGVLLAGAWSLAMSVEDVLPASPVAPWAAGLVALAALLRFGEPAWSRAVAALEPPQRFTEGLAAALVLAPVGLLAWMYGVPLWGLLPWSLP